MYKSDEACNFTPIHELHSVSDKRNIPPPLVITTFLYFTLERQSLVCVCVSTVFSQHSDNLLSFYNVILCSGNPIKTKKPISIGGCTIDSWYKPLGANSYYQTRIGGHEQIVFQFGHVRTCELLVCVSVNSC